MIIRAVLIAALVSAASANAAPIETTVTARPIVNFKIASSESKFGPLEFVGGLEMTSSSPHFSSLSAFRFRDAGAALLAICDNGFWVEGTITRDASGKPLAFEKVRLAEMSVEGRGAADMKWLSDAEGLLVEEDKITVSFERNHRISTGTLNPIDFNFTYRDEPLPVPGREIRSNRGFETLARAPITSPLKGARVAVTEKSLDKNGNIFAGIMDGANKGVFAIARQGNYDITDGDFLPNGDLLILERKFSMAEGIAMRIRKIDGTSIQKGKTVDGPVILEADMAYQIDNMEGLDIWQRADGATMISLMSDDNHSILQRNLYLEFQLKE